MPSSFQHKLRRRLTMSMLDQALLSAFGFALNLLLIRVWGPALFGIYAIIVALTMIGYSLQCALIGSQLASLRPKLAGRSEEHELLTTLWSANCALMAFVVLFVWTGATALWHQQYPLMPLAAGLFSGGTLLREYVRCFLFSEGNVPAVLLVDGVYTGAAAIGLSLLWIARGTLDLPLVCFLLATAATLAASLVLARRSASFSVHLDGVARYAAIWRSHSRWALLGATCAELVNRAHVFVVGTFFGVAAVGVLQAGEMIFRPLGMVLLGWERVAQPTFARLAATDNLASARRIAHLSVAGIVAICMLLFAAIWIGWPWLDSHVFRGAYPNIGLVLVLWGLATAFRAVAQVYAVELQGFARFRELSLIDIAASIVTLSFLLLVVFAASYEWSLMAVAAGRLVDLALMLAILSRIYETQGARVRLAPAPGGVWR